MPIFLNSPTISRSNSVPTQKDIFGFNFIPPTQLNLKTYSVVHISFKNFLCPFDIEFPPSFLVTHVGSRQYFNSYTRVVNFPSSENDINAQVLVICLEFFLYLYLHKQKQRVIAKRLPYLLPLRYIAFEALFYKHQAESESGDEQRLEFHVISIKTGGEEKSLERHEFRALFHSAKEN